eukprot:15035132-Alexandrium_andersonii.AAC.1
MRSQRHARACQGTGARHDPEHVRGVDAGASTSLAPIERRPQQSSTVPCCRLQITPLLGHSFGLPL